MSGDHTWAAGDTAYFRFWRAPDEPTITEVVLTGPYETLDGVGGWNFRCSPQWIDGAASDLLHPTREAALAALDADLVVRERAEAARHDRAGAEWARAAVARKALDP